MTLAISAAHARVLADLRSKWPSVNVVVIGAAALGHHIELTRTTRDVDLAVAVELDAIADLVEPLGWTRDPKVPIRWHGPDGFHADVLPATPDVLEKGEVRFEHADRAMNLLGFDLAFEHATEVALVGTAETIRVASLATIVVLKMVAWLDRPAERTKDLGDLASILEQALSKDDACRWDSDHPVRASQIPFDLQSSYFAGMTVGEVARDPHAEQVERFLTKLLADDDTYAAAQMAREAAYGWDGEERVRAMLGAFQPGFHDARRAGGNS
jgi:predicted nucleotidyltransferase